MDFDLKGQNLKIPCCYPCCEITMAHTVSVGSKQELFFKDARRRGMYAVHYQLGPCSAKRHSITFLQETSLLTSEKYLSM